MGDGAKDADIIGTVTLGDCQVPRRSACLA